ncbi:MAG: hypothetical protein ACRDZY_01220, partial [Acidimicrobiales bacterium]
VTPTPYGSPAACQDPDLEPGAGDLTPLQVARPRCQPCHHDRIPTLDPGCDWAEVVCCPVHYAQLIVTTAGLPPGLGMTRPQVDAEYPRLAADSPLWALMPTQPLYVVTAPTGVVRMLFPAATPAA